MFIQPLPKEWAFFRKCFYDFQQKILRYVFIKIFYYINVFVACKRYGERLQVDSHQSIDNKSNYSRRIFFRFEFDNGNDVRGFVRL